MSGTAAHMVRLYVSVAPGQPPSRKCLARNSSRMAARLGAKGSVTAAFSGGLETPGLRRTIHTGGTPGQEKGFMSTAASLVWFRADLRLADNPALSAAIDQGGPVVPVFVWAPEE